MSLPNYLAKIKSSGIYRFVWDKSEITATDAETLRLVVGYSEKGVFNSPVYIDNTKDFKTIFGDVNKKLEKRGVFFHRMALQALSAGPILAFNVKKFGTTEKLGYATATVANSALVTTDESKVEVKKVYNTDRFWRIDPDQLVDFPNADADDKVSLPNPYLIVSTTDSKETSSTIIMRPSSNSNYDVTVKTWYSTIGEDMPDYFIGYEDKLISDFLVEAYVFKGQFTESLAKTDELEKYFDVDKDNKVFVNNTVKNAFNQDVDALDALAANENSQFVQKYVGVTLPYFKDTYGSYISLDLIFNRDYEMHKMVMKFNSELLDDGTTKIEDLITKPSNKSTQILSAYYSNGVLSKLGPTYLEGYTMSDDLIKPASGLIADKLAWQNKILAAINPDSSVGYPGLVEALTNGTDIDYRYIVDTFESFPTSECKSGLALLAKTKDNAMLLSNFPSIHSFIKMGYVDTNGAFKIEYVKDATGSQYTGSAFSLPSVDNGASWCSFNTPVVFTDGTVKTTVPAATLVSNNFMVKYSTRQPYYIVAGPTYGRLSAPGMVGPDYNFTRHELDVLESLGVNATVYVPRKGTYISSNQTAKQTPVTALSKINVRELVIYLQDQIHDLLQNYQWEFNTQSLRDLIKNKADSICENVQANGGIYKFLNVCDESNNTDDVINNEMLVLSTFIEPGMGAGKMVQELTIYKKGGMTSVIR